MWTNGSEGGASTVELGGDLEYTASGTCFVNCVRLEAAGRFLATFTYSVVNAAERGASIVF